MNKSSVIDILKHFSEDDISNFNDFAISPFFNKNKSVNKLFVELKKYYPNFESDNLKKENIWKKIYPGKPFNYGVMKNLIHDLAKLLEEYITIFSFRNAVQRNYFLVEGLISRQIFNLYQKKALYFERKKDEFFKKSSSQLFYHVYSELNHLNLTHSVNDKLSTKIAETEQKFIACKIAYCLVQISRAFSDHIVLNVFKKEKHSKNNFSDIYFEIFKTKKIDEIISLLEKDFPNEYKILIIHRNMFLAYMNLKSFKHYIKFKESVFNFAGSVSKTELKLLCHKLRNLIAILRHNNVNDNLNHESMEIYEFMITENIFSHGGATVSEVSFNNYVTYLAEFKEDVKLENFILKFADSVAGHNAANAYNYAMANLMFLRGKYEKSLDFILKLSNDYEKLKILIKTLQVKCYYELNDYESFISLYNSFKKFDHKNTFGIEHQQKNLLGMCGFVNKLFKLKNYYAAAELKILRNKIANNELNNSLWLNEKAIEIEIANQKYKKNA